MEGGEAIDEVGGGVRAGEDGGVGLGFDVVADEQGAAGGDDVREQMAQVGRFVVGGDVAELGADEVEAARRSEGCAVGDGEAIGERGEAALREGDEGRRRSMPQTSRVRSRSAVQRMTHSTR